MEITNDTYLIRLQKGENQNDKIRMFHEKMKSLDDAIIQHTIEDKEWLKILKLS